MRLATFLWCSGVFSDFLGSIPHFYAVNSFSISLFSIFIVIFTLLRVLIKIKYFTSVRISQSFSIYKYNCANEQSMTIEGYLSGHRVDTTVKSMMCVYWNPRFKAMWSSIRRPQRDPLMSAVISGPCTQLGLPLVRHDAAAFMAHCVLRVSLNALCACEAPTASVPLHRQSAQFTFPLLPGA